MKPALRVTSLAHSCIASCVAALVATAATAATGVSGCSPRTDARAPNHGSTATRSSGTLAPSGVAFSAVERDGDPVGGIALAVATEGTAEASTIAAATLGGITEERIAARGFPGATAMIGAEGYRIHASIESPDAARKFIAAALAALAAPVMPDDVKSARAKLRALGTLPLLSGEEEAVARCKGEPRLRSQVREVDATALEEQRKQSHVSTRVAIAVTGSSALTSAALDAVNHAEPLPTGRDLRDPETSGAPFAVFEADVSGPETRAIVARSFHSAEEAIAAAERLAESPLSSRMASLDGGIFVRGITATARRWGGCLAVDITFSDLGRQPEQQIAAGIAMANEELALVASTGFSKGSLERTTRGISDPEAAAEAAAWLSLSRETDAEPVAFTRIGIRPSKSVPLKSDELEQALAAETSAQSRSGMTSRGRVERGQGELWVFLGSPCGTMQESNADSGLSAAAVEALVPERVRGAEIEPVATPDAVGLLAHGPALPGETPLQHARRLVDLIAQPMLGAPVSRDRAEHALRAAFTEAEDDDARALAALAAETSPGHLSWLVPKGAADALGSASDLAVAAKISALRGGPIRLAVLANDGEAQTQAALRAADRWMPSHIETRTCEPLAQPEVEHAGTYGILRTTPGPAEAFLSFQVPDAQRYGYAEVWVALLSGADGMLASALSSGLARESSVRLLGAPRAASVVVRLVTADGALDAAVAQTRALFSRLAQGAVTEEQIARAFARRTEAKLQRRKDPRNRVLDLFRDSPDDKADSATTLLQLGATMWTDSRLVIVALRPKRER